MTSTEKAIWFIDGLVTSGGCIPPLCLGWAVGKEVSTLADAPTGLGKSLATKRVRIGVKGSSWDWTSLGRGGETFCCCDDGASDLKSTGSCCHGLCEDDGGGWGLSIRSCGTSGFKLIEVSARLFFLNSWVSSSVSMFLGTKSVIVIRVCKEQPTMSMCPSQSCRQPKCL